MAVARVGDGDGDDNDTRGGKRVGIGVDGCRGGWVAAALHPDGRLDLRLAPRFVDAIAFAGVPARAPVLVDMPMGFTADGERGLEAAIRARLPRGRRSSVFPVPARAAFAGVDHADASARNARACGARLPIQTFMIMPKMAELDALLTAQARWRTRLFEAHPELCFHLLAGGGESALPRKRTAEGRAARRTVLRAHGVAVPDDWRAQLRHAGVSLGEDDLLDAVCLACVAGQRARWRFLRHPLRRADALGVPLRVVYPGPA